MRAVCRRALAADAGILALVTLSCALWPRVAHAYEDQLTLSIGGGYAHAFGAGLPHSGALLDVAGSTGLDESFTLRARLTGELHPHDEPLLRGVLGGELLYLIDVVEIVPQLGLGLDAVLSERFDDARADLGVHAVVGADYLLSRLLALSLDARPMLLLTDLDGAPFTLAITLSLTWMFER